MASTKELCDGIFMPNKDAFIQLSVDLRFKLYRNSDDALLKIMNFGCCLDLGTTLRVDAVQSSGISFKEEDFYILWNINKNSNYEISESTSYGNFDILINFKGFLKIQAILIHRMDGVISGNS